MRMDLVIVAAAIIFLGYAFFNDAAAVEMMWENFLQWLSTASILN